LPTHEAIYDGADIVAAVTDAARPVLEGDRLEAGCHVVNIGAGGSPDRRTLERCDVYLRFGDAPAPRGRPEYGLADEYLSFTAEAALPVLQNRPKGATEEPHGVLAREKLVSLAEIFDDRARGRKSADQITYSERGNLQGAQFWAVASLAYEAARDAGLGRDLPTEWFTQDIRN